MTLTLAENGKSITIELGEEVVVTLAENPTTGFRWSLETSHQAILELERTAFVPPTSAAVGSPGQRVYTFKASHTGSESLRMKLWRAWEGENSVCERIEITIQVVKPR